MNDSEKELIRARINIVDLVSQYTALRRAGSRFKALCPFHQEKTPSFNVDPERGLWHCYGACSTGGDIFSFLMKAEGLTFREALERLAERAGVTLSSRGVSPEEAARQKDEKSRLLAANVEAERFFQLSFQRAASARDYARKRGLAHETIERFGIGYAPPDWDSLANHLRARGVPLDDAQTVGLVFPRRGGDGHNDKFRGRLMFPIWDTQDRLVAFGGRLIEPIENAPKYLNSPETPLFSKSRILYAMNLARKPIQTEDRVLVVEGYMDAVAAHQAGIENVVATLGTSLTEEHVKLLGRYTRNVLLSFDSDAAGVRAALRAAELVTAAGPEYSLRILTMPPGDDPDSMLARGDVAGFRRAMDTARTVAEFRLEALQVAHDLRDDGGRIEFLREAVALIAEVASPLEEDNLLRRLAPFHPSFASGGSRAEESLRLEVRQQRLARRGIAAPTPYSDQPLGGGGSGDGAPRRWSGGGGWNGGGGGAGAGRGFGDGQSRGNWAARKRDDERERNRLVSRETAPPASLSRASAAERAERTLLRALLTDDWVRTVLERLADGNGAELFQTPAHRQLFETVHPLLVGRLRPSRVVAELSDRTLSNVATAILLGDADDEPISLELIDGCLEKLVAVNLRNRERRIFLAQSEGSDEMDVEQLKRWYDLARTRKSGGPPS